MLSISPKPPASSFSFSLHFIPFALSPFSPALNVLTEPGERRYGTINSCHVSQLEDRRHELCLEDATCLRTVRLRR